jgi:hypothetical protein
MSAELAADILAAGESALERGQELRAGIAWLTAQLEAMLGDDFGDSRCDIDPLAISEALGLLAIDEAIEVASGETEHGSCSAAIMSRQRWLASRRLRHRIASLRSCLRRSWCRSSGGRDCWACGPG